MVKKGCKSSGCSIGSNRVGRKGEKLIWKAWEEGVVGGREIPQSCVRKTSYSWSCSTFFSSLAIMFGIGCEFPLFRGFEADSFAELADPTSCTGLVFSPKGWGSEWAGTFDAPHPIFTGEVRCWQHSPGQPLIRDAPNSCTGPHNRIREEPPGNLNRRFQNQCFPQSSHVHEL